MTDLKPDILFLKGYIYELYEFYTNRTYASYIDLARHAEFISASPSNSRKILKQVQNDGELRKSWYEVRCWRFEVRYWSWKL